MSVQQKRVARQGRIYRFNVDGTEYSAFIWQAGSQFCGRVEENPQVPQCKARTAIAVRDALSAWLATAKAKEQSA
jgi:hypothetical protein